MMDFSRKAQLFTITTAAGGASYKEQIEHEDALCSPRIAHSLSAFRILPAAYGLLSKSSFTTNALSCAIPSAVAIAFSNAAAEPASMGSGDFVSWTAVRSHARNRADRIRRDLACDRWWTGAL